MLATGVAPSPPPAEAHASGIWIRAADQNFSMPPVGPPPEDERALLGEWLACGAPTDAELGM